MAAVVADKTNAPMPVDGAAAPQQFIAFAQYTPVHADEIALNVGDVISLVHSYDDGWILGKNLNTIAVGLAPCNFLQPHVPGQSAAAPASAAPATTVAAAPSSGPTTAAATANTVTSGSAPNRTASLVLRSRRTSKASTFEQLVDKLNKDLPPGGKGIDSPGETRPPLPANAVLQRPQVPAPEPPPPHVEPIKELPSLEAVKKRIDDIARDKDSRARKSEDVGRIRIAFAGDSGIGKTSLLRHFLANPRVYHTSPDIATLGPVEPTPFAILEYHASTSSTTPTPNLSLVDTPGFGHVLDAQDVIRPILSHLLAQFRATDAVFTRQTSSQQLLRFLSADTGAHTHIDVVIYCILHRLTPVDIEYMRRLDRFTAVVPVITRADTMRQDEVVALKHEIAKTIRAAGVDVYTFGLEPEELTVAERGYPFAVCVPRDGSAATSPTSPTTADATSPSAGTKDSSASMLAVDGVATPPESPPPRNPKRLTSRRAATTGAGAAVDEFDALWRAVMIAHVNDLRRVTAERFVRWRAAGSKNEV
ncbi:hypothetical protein HDU87_000342 [Geranomyces variabilis]|uniref:SH3 domain-containing protein n=1 Tax=Geranomyces variabilis TaxID=109894 RepID=A0AAD5TR07_9FUNG|nr:hypothetical protein HDU87_000342 [Geranomyces variabilis]